MLENHKPQILPKDFITIAKISPKKIALKNLISYYMVVHPTHTDIGVKVLMRKADLSMSGDQFGIQERWAEIECFFGNIL